MKRRPSKWDKPKPIDEPLVPPERLRHQPETYQDPIIVLAAKTDGQGNALLSPSMESACEEYRRLWRAVVAVPVFPKGTLDDSMGRSLRAENERRARADMARFRETADILGQAYPLFRDVVIYWRYPFYETAAFLAACRVLARAWRMEMRRAS